MLYKRVDDQLCSCNGGTHQWVLGQTVSVPLPLNPCRQGFHLCRVEHLSHWRGTTILAVEASGQQLDHHDKIVVETVRATAIVGRLTDAHLWLLAADYAEHVLPTFEARYPGDDRPRRAIVALRQFAVGIISLDVVSPATADADAYAYASVAASDYAAVAASAAAYAASDEVAERQWQGERLLAYASGWLPPAAEPYRATIEAAL